MRAITKNEVYKQELEKLTEIFKDIEDQQRKLSEGLIDETAYLKAELYDMRQVLEEVGMIKVNPNNKTQQKTMPIANEYRRTANIYALNVKTLNGILMKNAIEGEDEFEKWIKAKQEKNE